jgi:hypothetical protein
MHPVIAGLQAFHTAVAAGRDIADLGEMRAGVHRGKPLLSAVVNAAFYQPDD